MGLVVAQKGSTGGEWPKVMLKHASVSDGAEGVGAKGPTLPIGLPSEGSSALFLASLLLLVDRLLIDRDMLSPKNASIRFDPMFSKIRGTLGVRCESA